MSAHPLDRSLGAAPGDTAPPGNAAPGNAALCEVRGLVVRYGATVAVDHADLDVTPRRITAILGASGCGKTSLLRAIAGFGEVAAGEITIAGERVVGPGVWVPPERRHVGMVFQEGALFPHLTVKRNVAYGLRRDDAAASRVAEMLRLVGLEEMGRRFPDELSGGQQQRVALARALAPRPSLVLLDEPFASLDAVLRVHLREEVRRILAALGTTAVLVTHEQEEALSIADMVAVMEQGRVVQVGSPEEIYHRPATASVAAFVGGGQLLACHVVTGRAHTALGDVPVVMAASSRPEGEPCSRGEPAASGGTSAVSRAPYAHASGAPGVPALLLVRPEDLEVLPPDAATGASATVLRRQFFGHDAIDELALVDAWCGLDVLRARYLAGDHAPTGDRVRLRLRPKTYTCYPRPD